jgi:hypothetical protein
LVTLFDGKPPWCVITWCSVISLLPRDANSGKWSATRSMKDSLPSSTSVHTAAEVSTLVCENSRNTVSLVAGCLTGSVRALP